MAARQVRPGTEAVRITTASESRGKDIATRQRRYVVSMTIRTLCFVGAVAVGPGWLRWTLVVLAFGLPYVAVLLANAGNTRDEGFELPQNPSQRPQLGTSRNAG